jgi:PEP-CTERM motif
MIRRPLAPATLLGCVTLALTLTVSARAGGILPQTASFQDVLPPSANHSMGLAFDGTSYWETSGGNTNGDREAQYNAAGVNLGIFQPGLDFRSVFTGAGGAIYGSTFSSNVIYHQTSPGVWAPFVTLVGGNLNSQSDVVLDGAKTEYIANNNGVIGRWDLSGNFLGTTNLIGFGSQGTEASFPQAVRLAAVGSTWLTYSDGVMSTWDMSGNRIDTNTLAGAGQMFDSYFSFSYANGMAWVVDTTQGTYRGYAYGASSAVPEPSSIAMAAMGGIVLAGSYVLRFRRSRCG